MSRYEQNIVVDLEFTPVDKGAKTRKFKYEIIQIGAVRVSSDGEIKDSFSSFCEARVHKEHRLRRARADWNQDAQFDQRGYLRADSREVP